MARQGKRRSQQLSWFSYMDCQTQEPEALGIRERKVEEMDVEGGGGSVSGWSFGRIRNAMAEDILAGKIVPVGCLAQFQALGPKADWLPFQTLQFGYRLGLVGARAVVELMVDREQRGLLLTKTELRLASLREDELEDQSSFRPGGLKLMVSLLIHCSSDTE